MGRTSKAISQSKKTTRYSLFQTFSKKLSWASPVPPHQSPPISVIYCCVTNCRTNEPVFSLCVWRSAAGAPELRSGCQPGLGAHLKVPPSPFPFSPSQGRGALPVIGLLPLSSLPALLPRLCVTRGWKPAKNNVPDAFASWLPGRLF